VWRGKRSYLKRIGDEVGMHYFQLVRGARESVTAKKVAGRAPKRCSEATWLKEVHQKKRGRIDSAGRAPGNRRPEVSEYGRVRGGGRGDCFKDNSKG